MERGGTEVGKATRITGRVTDRWNDNVYLAGKDRDYFFRVPHWVDGRMIQGGDWLEIKAWPGGISLPSWRARPVQYVNFASLLLVGRGSVRRQEVE